MNVTTALTDIAAAVDGLQGIRAYAYPVEHLEPPAAWCQVREVDYRFAGASGQMLTVELVVVVGRPDDRASHDRMTALLADTSVVAAVEAAHPAEADSAVCTGAEVEDALMSGTPVRVITFTFELIGD